MNVLKLYHLRKRIALTDDISVKQYILSTMKAFLITLFIMFAPLVVGINGLIVLILYKSLWSIIIGFILIYCIVMCFWNADRLFRKYNGFNELEEYKDDFLLFYNMLAIALAFIGVIVILFEVM